MKKNINYGLSVLKTILSFLVIKTHFFRLSSTKNKIVIGLFGKNRPIHVPSFFIMSFYFNYKCFVSKDSKKYYKRFERLLIPYIFWPIIIYSINNIFCRYNDVKPQFTIYNLITQIILGFGIIDPLWFLIISILFYYDNFLYSRIFKNSLLFI